MTIPFTCPFCGRKTDVEEQYAGQSGSCVQCGKTITVPPLARADGEEPRKRTQLSQAIGIIGLVVALGLLVMCAGLLGPWSFRPHDAARRAQCRNNLKQLAIALRYYESAHGTFPPAYVTDKAGKPLYSWRVLILPYMDGKDLYDSFHLDEPWNSPHNLPLSRVALNGFQCPSDSSAARGETSYVMAVGPGMISDGPTGRRERNIRDGLSNTILLVEMSNSGIPWSEPRDWDVSSGTIAVNDPNVPGPRSNHTGLAMVAFCDGSVSEFAESIDPKLLRGLLTIAGGEDVSVFYDP